MSLERRGRGIAYVGTPVEARCPACLNERGQLLYTVTSEQCAQHLVLREAQAERHDALRAHIEALWSGPTSRLVACTRCGFTFAEPFVAGDHRFFDLAYERTGYPTWRWEFGHTREALERAFGADDLHQLQILELGAGDGAFMRLLVPTPVPAENVLCTEFSAFGLRMIRASGIPAVDGDARALGTEYGGRFDVVCMFQIVEHLDDLDGLFGKLNMLTRPSASLFISVPNGRRIEFNERNGSLLDLPPNHTGRWTRAAFDAIAARHGWRVEAYAVELESVRSRAREFLTYVYLRNRQDPATVENRVERLPRGPVRTALRALLAGSNAFRSVASLYELLRRDDVGGSQWVHLTRGPT